MLTPLTLHNVQLPLSWFRWNNRFPSGSDMSCDIVTLTTSAKCQLSTVPSGLHAFKAKDGKAVTAVAHYCCTTLLDTPPWLIKRLYFIRCLLLSFLHSSKINPQTQKLFLKLLQIGFVSQESLSLLICLTQKVVAGGWCVGAEMNMAPAPMVVGRGRDRRQVTAGPAWTHSSCSCHSCQVSSMINNNNASYSQKHQSFQRNRNIYLQSSIMIIMQKELLI